MKVKVEKAFTYYAPDDFEPHKTDDLIGKECEIIESTKGKTTVFLLKFENKTFPFLSKEFLLEHCSILEE